MEFVGRKVKVELQDGSVYDGFVHSYNTNIGKLSLEKVTCHEDNDRKKLIGLQHFFADEIADIIAEEEVLRNKNKEQTVKDRGYSILKPKCNPAHLRRLKFLDPSKLLLKNQTDKDGLGSSGNESVGSDSEGEGGSNKEYTILPKTNTLFYEALGHIKKHQVVGMAMEGVSIGREGQLCWLQISVPDHVFLFDMLQLGQDGFDEGLAAIIENEDILKVIHNCRMMSDILHHQYSISLVNVFDTQVANVFVFRLWNHNNWPRYVDGLAACLVEHLDLSMEEVNWAVVRERFRESDEEVWLERPVRRVLVEALVKNVKHLIPLRQVLVDKMMAEFVSGINIYLSHVRDASAGDARKYMKEPYLLPMAFQDIRQFMISYSGRNRHFAARNNATNMTKDRNGFRENLTIIRQPDVYFSHDSLWHAGSRIEKKKGSTGEKSLGRYADTVADLVPNTTPPTATLQQERAAAELSATPSSADCPKTPQQSISHSVLADYLQKSPEKSVFGGFLKKSSETSSLLDECPKFTPTVPDCAGDRQTDTMDRQTNQTNGEMKTEDVTPLSGTSLMRALIHEQAPEGREDHSDIKGISIVPAGKMVPKGVKKPRGGSSHAPHMVIPDLNRYSSTGAHKKTLTEQERKMMSQMTNHHRRNTSQPSFAEEDWSDSDSVLAQPRPQQEVPEERLSTRAQGVSKSPNSAVDHNQGNQRLTDLNRTQDISRSQNDSAIDPPGNHSKSALYKSNSALNYSSDPLRKQYASSSVIQTAFSNRSLQQTPPTNGTRMQPHAASISVNQSLSSNIPRIQTLPASSSVNRSPQASISVIQSPQTNSSVIQSPPSGSVICSPPANISGTQTVQRTSASRLQTLLSLVGSQTG